MYVSNNDFFMYMTRYIKQDGNIYVYIENNTLELYK
jgi:hypothetical protein